jgi:dTDP-glucose 4,6-dehydratase
MSASHLAADLDYILEQTPTVWEELKGQRLFITGGTGFIGTWLLEAILWANRRLALDLSVTALTRDVEAFNRKAPHLAHDPALVFLRGDVRHFGFPSDTFSHVIHAATPASARLNSENPQAMFDTILEGTRNTLAFSAEALAAKFLFLSSGAVYGKQPSDLSHVDETYAGAPDILNPASAYAVGKAAAEHLCILHAAQHPVAMKIARCFAFVGPYLPLDIHFAIGNFIQDAMAGRTITVKGDGTPFRSYQYAADLAIWLLQILCHGESCVPYNVGSDEAVSIADVAQRVAEQFNPRCEVAILKTPSALQLAERYVPSVKRAQTELGLSVGIGLTEAIAKTIAWHAHSLNRVEV